MSGADTVAQKIKRYLYSLPGKRGIDIPEDKFDQIFDVAHGITAPIWGRPPTPEQMQALYDGGHHTPEAIHGVFMDMPHPHAPNLKVGEYAQYHQALSQYKRHR